MISLLEEVERLQAAEKLLKQATIPEEEFDSATLAEMMERDLTE